VSSVILGIAVISYFIGSAHLKISATEQFTNIKCCVLLNRMLEEACSKAEIKETQVYE
jgi:hypothetical protein